jgi:hypothetical protein
MLVGQNGEGFYVSLSYVERKNPPFFFSDCVQRMQTVTVIRWGKSRMRYGLASLLRGRRYPTTFRCVRCMRGVLEAHLLQVWARS